MADILCGFDSFDYQVWDPEHLQYRSVLIADYSQLIDFCAGGTVSDVSLCIKSRLQCQDYVPRQCVAGSDFYNDFNNAVNNTAMSVFLASVMAGILAVRAVIKIIKGAVR